MPTSTVENYLKAILVRSSDNDEIVAMGALAEALAVTPGSVHPDNPNLSETELKTILGDDGFKAMQDFRRVQPTISKADPTPSAPLIPGRPGPAPNFLPDERGQGRAAGGPVHGARPAGHPAPKCCCSLPGSLPEQRPECSAA